MESRRGNEKVQYQSRVRLFKRYLTFMLAVVVLFTSIPLNVAWADELPYFEQPGDDEIILDDAVEEGDLSDIDLDITHTISKKGDKAVVTVFAAPSESGRENGVTKITKVEIHQNGKLKKGKRSDGKWEFTVKENGIYSFVIYYNSSDGEDMIVASPSEIEKVEPTTETKPQPPEVNAGGAGGGGVKPEENPDQDVTTPETDEGTVEDGNTEEDKNNGETVEGDSNQDTSNKPEQNPSDNSGTDEDKEDTTENDGGTDSSGQAGNSDDSTDGGNIDSSTDEENSNSSSSSDNNSDTSSDDNSDSSSSDNSGAGSTDNGSSDSSSDSNSGSSDSEGSDSSSDSDSSSSDSGSADTSDSSDSGSSDNGGSDEDSDSSDTSIALNVIDFIFPVIEAQASDFTVKKAVIVEYEITNLFPEGNPEDVDVDIFDEPTEEGAMITLLAEPSEIGLENGVKEITAVSLMDFEPEDDSEIIDDGEINTATDSEAEEEMTEEEVVEASPSDATYDTSKSSNAKHAEYQASESEEGEYRFFVKENGTYTFSIRYGRAADLDFEDSTELVETQFLTIYELDSIERGVQFAGVEDISIQAGEAFDLMAGVSAISEMGIELPVVVQDNGEFDPAIPGTYTITYTIASRSIIDNGTTERQIIVMPKSAGELKISSDVHGSEDGKTLTVPIGRTVSGMLSVSYDLPVGVTGRVLKFRWPTGSSGIVYPTDHIRSKYTENIEGEKYTCLLIDDNISGELSFDVPYKICVGSSNLSKIEYLEANGNLNLGDIAVIASDKNETSEQEVSLGLFITEQCQNGSYEFYYSDGSGGRHSGPISYQMAADTRGTMLGTYALTGASEKNYGWNLKEPDFNSGYKPSIVKEMKIYAPPQFQFDIGDLDEKEKKYVETGFDEENNSYLIYRNPVEGNFTRAFYRIKITAQENVALYAGFHKSKPTELICIDYGENRENSIEVTPVLNVNVNLVNCIEKDMIKIEKYITSPDIVEIKEGFSTFIRSHTFTNGVQYTGTSTSEGVREVFIPNRKQNIKFMVDYPQEVQPTEWMISYKADQDSFERALDVDKVIMYFNTGESQEAILRSDLSSQMTWVSGLEEGDIRHIDSIEIVFKNFYGYKCDLGTYLQAGFLADNLDKNGYIVEKTICDGKEISVEKQFIIKVLENMELNASAPGYSLFDEKNGENRGYIQLGYKKNGKANSLEITTNDEKLLNQLTGKAIITDDSVGGKIEFETSKGRKGIYEITEKGAVQFATLEENETFTKFVYSKAGVFVYGNSSYQLLRLECKILRKDILSLWNGIDRRVYFSNNLSYKYDGINEPIDIEAKGWYDLFYEETLAPVSYSSSNAYKVYQGENVTIQPGDFVFSQSGSVVGDYPFYPDLYIELENADKFLFAGVNDSNYQVQLINKGEARYLKIKANDIKMYNYFAYTQTYSLPHLDFKVIPGAAIGTYSPIGKLYVDLGPMINDADKINEQYRLKLIWRDLVEDTQGLSAAIEGDGPHMWEFSVSDNSLPQVEILQQSLESVTITPGKAGIYQDRQVDFFPTERKKLNAMVSIGTGNSGATEYTSKILLPKNGQEITYSLNGLNQAAISDYDMYLIHEPKVVANNTGTVLSYRLKENNHFVSASEVGDAWKNVVEIQAYTSNMPAKSTALLYLDLESEAKGAVGIGEKYAYMAAEYEYNGTSKHYGPMSEFKYLDYQIEGKVWIDNNEDGKYDLGEAIVSNMDLTLLQNGTNAQTDSYSLSVDRGNGNYVLTTYLYEDLSLRFDGLNKNKAGIKPTLVKDGTNGSTSVFERGDEWTATLPAYFDEHQSGYDLGIVKLPVLTANNTQVGYKSEAQANVNVINQTNAPAVNSQIIYGEADDPSIATVGYTGLIKGLKENSLTTATASVINSLGDKVTATYQIAVSDNKVPILTVHPWVAIEGDSIPDLWHGVTAEDPAEEFPAWKIFLLGANKSSRSIPDGNKVVTIYTDGDYTDEIALDDALKAYGLYYVRYSVEDDKENVVTADTTLTVYGKIQGVGTTKHYFQTGETITVPNAEFYYLDVSGAQVPVTEGIHTVGENKWILNEGPLKTVAQTAVHPQAVLVSDGVIAGVGREVTANVGALVDSTIHANPRLPEIIVIQYESVEPVRWMRYEGMYRHWKSESEQESLYAERSVGADGVTAPGDKLETDTSVPGIYYTFRHAVVNEEYDNVDIDGQPLKNMLHQINRTIVVSKPVVEATEKIYVTPDQALDESFIKGEITTTATYHDGTNPTAAIPDNQIKYVYNKTDGKITSVTITAWGGREDNISDPAQATVVIREVPILTLPYIHLRRGTVYGPENFADRVLTPSDEHNAYIYISNNLDTNTLGKYEAQYQVSDDLTGAEADQFQTIYVHGIPEITATDKSLYAHQSTNEQALIDEVKKSATATVVYTKEDGITETKTIPSNELQYEVSDYAAGAAGRFKVTITANDKNYVPGGLAPMQVTKEVYVDVADQLFDVTFTTNNDNFHNRGTIDGGVSPVVNSTIYGHAAVVAVPAANDGYHFDGFKTLSQLKATHELTLGDGTVIAAGDEIPVGSMLSVEQVQTIKIYGDAEFQAYFSATPVLNGRNIKLYVGETYNQADLNITVSDLDGDAQAIVVEDSHVDTSRAGTYQIKVSVADDDQNQEEDYVYVQVYGKTELEGYDPIHIRKGQDLSEEQLAGTIQATYEAPPAVPDSPWNETSQPAVQTEISFELAGTVDTQVIGLTKLTISAKGQIEGRESDGQDNAVKDVFVHGNPIIIADDGALYTHQSTGQTILIDLIKQNAAASIQYVEPDGSVRTETIAANKLNYEIKPEENYQPQTEGTYKVTISFNDTDYVPNGLQPVDAELLAAVIVSNKAYSVKFSINNDEDHHKGDYEGGISEFSTNAIHGNPVGRVPVPVESAGYHFNGFKTLTAFTTTDDIQLADGSTISAGTQIPVGTILTLTQLESMKIYSDLQFQAYFSASPVINGENVVLYEKEAYSQDKLHIEVTDLDGNAQLPVIDDSHVDTNVAGTYQLKVTVNDADGNQTVKYLYVQVVGKTEFINIPDLHIRKDAAVTEEMLMANVKAVYAKPEEIPEEPWAEVSKVNNGHAAITTAVEVHSYDVVTTDTIQKTKINLSAPGMIHGREMTGKADAERMIYIHGMPVIVAYDNGIYTHQSTSDTVLKQIVKTGSGTLERDAASAYVEYVQPDGSIKRVEIDPSKITYTLNQFVPLTAGDYFVSAEVDDLSVIAQAQTADLSFATGEKAVKIVVADKMYSVMFEMSEHGGLEDPTESITAVAHGKKVTSPKLAPEEGYKLDYWVDEAGNRISDINDIVITENRKFTAEFKLKEFTVRFIGKKDRVIKTEIVKYGFDATPPTEDKDVKSKRFNGWSADYTNITEDIDIYTTYWTKSGGGGPSGGGSFVPSGPGMDTTGGTTITDADVPKNPFDNLVTIETNHVPTGNMDLPVFTGLPKTGDISVGSKANIGYQASLIDGTKVLSENEPLVGHQNGSFAHVFEEHADWKKCILHIILLIVSALEGIFYFFKRRKDKRLLEELRKELEEEDK